METNEFDLNSLLEVSLAKEDDFLKIKETLTRIGVSSKKDIEIIKEIKLF